MRFSILTIISALSATAFAQSIADLPTCSQSCVTNGFASSGCSQVDIACICKSTAYVSGLSCCVATNCNAADQATTIKFATQLCAVSGVTNLPTTASCSNGTSSAVSSSSTAGTGTSATTGSGTSSTAASVASSSSPAATRNAAENLAQGLGFGAMAAGVAALIL